MAPNTVSQGIVRGGLKRNGLGGGDQLRKVLPRLIVAFPGSWRGRHLSTRAYGSSLVGGETRLPVTDSLGGSAWPGGGQTLASPHLPAELGEGLREKGVGTGVSQTILPLHPMLLQKWNQAKNQPGSYHQEGKK